MILSGRIGPFRVPDIFQLLATGHLTGQLVVETPGDQGQVWLLQGEVIYARRRKPHEKLGERLLRLGHISESQLAGANLRASLSQESKRIGQIFLESGSLDGETLQKVIKDQILETVAAIAEFSEGEFRFLADRLPEGEDILLDLSLDLLLQEVDRRRAAERDDRADA